MTAALLGLCGTWLFAQRGAGDRIERDLRELGAVLADESAAQSRRDEAARRLVSRKSAASTPEAEAVVGPLARELLGAALVNVSSRGGQLAVARALAQQAEPDPAFIAPLNALLGNDRQLTEAAATALANYTGSPQVPGLLLAFAASGQRPEASRVAVIRAVGAMPEKQVAEGLLGLMEQGESEAIRLAAASALGDLTGLPQFGTDAARWASWWAQAQRLTEVEFRAQVSLTRAAQHNRLRQRFDQLTEELSSLIPDGYRHVPESERADRLLRLLRSSQPSIRQLGVRIVLSDVLEARPVPQAAREALRQMVGDSSRAVRLEVAMALRSINDAAALEPLLTQLPQETSPEVRASIASALGPIRDVRAAEALVGLLADPEIRVAEAAAESLTALGPELRRSEVMAQSVAMVLRDTLSGRAAEPGGEVLRAGLLEALVPLRRREMIPLAQSMLEPGQPVRVRRAAIRLLGELRDPNTAESIRAVLESADTEPGLRLDAVVALGTLPTFDQAEVLYRRTLPEVEPDATVRGRAWLLLSDLFDLANRQQLKAWSERLRGDGARQLVVLSALADQLRNPGDDEALALVRGEQGEVLLGLDRAAEASILLRQSLEYWRGRGAVNEYVAGLCLSALEALLRSRQYAEAAGLASRSITELDPPGQRLGERLLEEVGRLAVEEEKEAASLLLAEIRRAELPLSEPLRERLAGLLERVNGVPATQPTTAPATTRAAVPEAR